MRRPLIPPAYVTVVAVLIGAFAGCGSSHRSAAPPTTASTLIPTPTSSMDPNPSTVPGTDTGTTSTTSSTVNAPTASPSFRATVTTVTAADLPATYRAGCPVGPGQLRMLHVRFWGFDGAPHDGSIVVAADVSVPVVSVFRSLFDQRFPIRTMRPEDAYGGHDPDSMTADNTSGFNCRNAVASGPPHWSAHAYGTAIDINPVENPYIEGGAVQPANGAAYVDRAHARAGMAEPGGVLNQAFAAIGWQWGGRWSTPDYQHFSANGG